MQKIRDDRVKIHWVKCTGDTRDRFVSIKDDGDVEEDKRRRHF